MLKIPFLNLYLQYRAIKKEIDSAIQKVIEDSAFSGGKYVAKFEKQFAKYIGIKYAVGVNSGTSALHLALVALGIGKGDEVIMPGNTFIATVWAVSYVGAKPVFVDCNPDTWQIDETRVKGQISNKVKAIIGVHLFGQPFDIEKVLRICRKHKLYLIEDCAQAHGAIYKGIKVGSYGDLACFSFYPGKNLGAYGEAGAVLTNNARYAERMSRLRNHSSVKKYQHNEIGFNMRMDGIQAAVLSIKLKYLDKWNRRRKEIANIYRTKIINPLIKMQYQPSGSESAYHLFVVTSKNMDKFIKFLKKNGIEALIHYPIPCHLQQAYQDLGYKRGDLPVTEEFAENCVSLPIYPELEKQAINKICQVVNRYEG